MMKYVAISALVVTVAFSVGADPTKPGQSFDARLMPKAKLTVNTPMLKKLANSKWSHRSPRTILGRGTDTILTFDKLQEDKPFKAKRTVVSHLGVKGGRKPPRTHEMALDVQIRGPLMQLGNSVRTFAVDEKNLVLGAVLPVGKNKWYYFSNTGRGPYEYLFEFAINPLDNDAGRAIAHRRIRGTVVKAPASFKSVKSGPGRKITLLSDVVKGTAHNFTEITLYPNKSYGITNGFLADRPEILTKAK